MGKNLIQQARGKGGPTYRAPSHAFQGQAKHRSFSREGNVQGTVVDIINCPGHTAPLAVIQYDDGEKNLTIAPEGIATGDIVQAGEDAELWAGNIAFLRNIPEGTLIYNIESSPGDGGKFVRSSGTFARVVSHQKGRVSVMLPSKKRRDFSGECRAAISLAAGGGRTEKPFYKAGRKYHAKRAKNKLYPMISGAAQNAVDHPFGNTRSSRKSKARTVPKNAPPGRKVGMLRARRTGRKKK